MCFPAPQKDGVGMTTLDQLQCLALENNDSIARGTKAMFFPLLVLCGSRHQNTKKSTTPHLLSVLNFIIRIMGFL